jgi:hypothetical protein
MSKLIKFKARNKKEFDIQLKPYPASENIPSWWKEETPYQISNENPSGNKILIRDTYSNATFKKCTPMLDAIVSGYIVPLWSDVQVTQTLNGPLVTWKTERNVFEIHGESSQKVVPPTGYSNFVFKYLNTWIPITPSGYSVLITSPFGHRDLPFHAIPAIIDSDKSLLEVVNPCWLKNDFEGIIEKGTPIMQITPFKRENWNSEFEYFNNDDFNIVQEKNFNSTIISHYLKNAWSRKSYK